MQKPMFETAEQFPVLGLPVHLLDNYSNYLDDRLTKGLGSHVVTLNAEMAIQGERNPELAAVIKQAELVIPDGAGIIFYLRLHGKKKQRCPGIELAQSLLAKAGQYGESCPVFFFGAAPHVVQKTARVWQKRVPNLAIAGISDGYLSAEAEEELKLTLKQQQPKIILVGLGVPRQEFWIAQNRHLCPQSIWIGVGGSFDIWSGAKTRAPAWFRNNNLEWLYRLYQEPHRWRRMMVLPQFALKALGQRMMVLPKFALKALGQRMA
ncbi:WecB/TagA/CpsF family glycosyltransferase [Moorena sp. SIO3H5]|uniref:WecB/TagA/CpsF family glycosyltransferase n=1 Tax=Moorena sp. SIO3H5 TaxID=2607834 RepID=UPI0013BCB56D|nr:WecB/TagA/CpsF family glycosyltransferase [Moorena sp. SIO3H5]NEO68130.1 WecB/TagA/CpsF family glycosyltransferase [Moorena sp. SIO3H5]